MTSIKAFIIAPTLFFSASLVCMDQRLTPEEQKVVTIKNKQQSYFENCETIGTHNGGKPLLKALGYSCLLNATFDLEAAVMFPEAAPQMIGGAALNALGALIMYTSSGALERKKDAAEKDIATLLNDLDALLAQDGSIKTKQLAVGKLHTEIGDHKAKSNAYLGGALICVGNVAKNLLIVRSLADVIKTNQYLGTYLTAERFTNYLFGILALSYSHSEHTQEKAISTTKENEYTQLTALVDSIAKTKKVSNKKK